MFPHVRRPESWMAEFAGRCHCRALWLFELNITAPQRDRGVGSQVIDLVEAEVRRSGGSSISLRVFDHNVTARSLYRRSGYWAVSTLLRKVL